MARHPRTARYGLSAPIVALVLAVAGCAINGPPVAVPLDQSPITVSSSSGLRVTDVTRKDGNAGIVYEAHVRGPAGAGQVWVHRLIASSYGLRSINLESSLSPANPDDDSMTWGESGSFGPRGQETTYRFSTRSDARACVAFSRSLAVHSSVPNMSQAVAIGQLCRSKPFTPAEAETLINAIGYRNLQG